MADSRAGTENYRISLEHLVGQRVRKCSMNNGDRSKRHEVSSNGYDWGKWQIWGKLSTKIISFSFSLISLFGWLSIFINEQGMIE